MEKSILIIFLMSIILSCERKIDTFNEIPNLSISGKKYYLSSKVNPSNTRFRYYQNSLYWIDYHQDEFLYSMAEPKNSDHSIKSHNIVKGKGPNEFMMVLFPKRVGNYLSFVDSFSGSLFFFNNDTLFKEFQLTGFSPIEIQGIVKTDHNRYLYSGVLETRFVLCDSTQSILSKYSLFPGKLNELSYKMDEKNAACQNHYVAKKDAFVNIIYDSGIIEFFEIRKDSIIKKRENIYNDFEFSIINDGGATRISSEKSNTGFIDISASDKHVFALYSTISWEENVDLAYFGNYVLMYSWKGEPIKAFKLDVPLRGFSVVPDKDVFWGWGHDSGGVYFAEYSF